MKTGWLNQQENPSCILFFTGWGMDPVPFEKIPVHEHDLLIIYDYNQLQTINPHDLTNKKYDTLHLVAWSMGVWAAASMIVNANDYFASTTAINGTLTPIDNKCGIASTTYDRMIDHFSKAALDEFYLSMFTVKEEAALFLNNRPQRSPENIISELVALKKMYSLYGIPNDCYNRKIVGSRDRVFSARNQTRSWGKDKSTLLKVSHFPFYAWPSWDSFLQHGRNSL